MSKIKMNEFIHWPFAHGVRVSPNGRHVVYALTRVNGLKNNYETNLYVYRPELGRSLPLTSGGASAGFAFIEDDVLLFSSARENTHREKQKHETAFWTIDLNGGEAQYAFTVELNVDAFEPLGDGRFLITGFRDFDRSLDWTEIEDLPFWYNGAGYTSGLRTGLYLFDAQRAIAAERETLETDMDASAEKLRSGTEAEAHKPESQLDAGILTLLTASNEAVSGLQVSADRTKALFVSERYDHLMPLKSRLFALDIASLTVSELTEKPYSIRRALFDADGTDRILVIAAEGDTNGINEDPQIYETTLDGGLHRISKPDFDRSPGNSVGTDARFGHGQSMKSTGQGLYFIETAGDHAVLNSFNPDGNVECIIGGEGAIESFDLFGDKLYYLAMRGLDLAELFVFDGQEHRRLTDFSEALRGLKLSPVEAFTFESNGATLTGYVIKPLDFDPQKRYPGILSVHGGPKTVFGSILHHEMQWLAAQGYFVFYTNPHGSDGHGVAYSDIRGRYGEIDYEDLMTFTDTVLARYSALDGERLGVMGGSYGGFMTNWIIGHTDRFKAANAQRSISNWISFYGVSDIGYYFAPDQTAADPWSSLDKAWAQSPLKYAPNVSTPTLFIHADADFRCPLEQGQQMYSALRVNGVDARLIVFKDETHELSRSGRPNGRLKRLSEIGGWFNRYLKPADDRQDA